MAATQEPSLSSKPPSSSPSGKGWQGGASGSVIAPHEARCLLDLLYDGYYMVSLLRNRYSPSDASAFRDRIRQFLVNFEHGGRRLGAGADDIQLSKFAYCALIDEVVLSKESLRAEWERRPLQLELFGEQLAGERFFEHLESLRQEGGAKLQVLEVFHMCLLLGFEGRYALEGTEKLNYLTGRLGDEIAHLRDKPSSFAPHWAPPDRIVNSLKGEVPLWLIGSAFGLLAVIAFTGLRASLDRRTWTDLGAYSHLVRLAPQAPNITITLP